MDISKLMLSISVFFAGLILSIITYYIVPPIMDAGDQIFALGTTEKAIIWVGIIAIDFMVMIFLPLYWGITALIEQKDSTL